MSHGGKTRRNEKIIHLIIIITFIVLVIIFYYLIDYLRSILVSFVVYRLAITFAILIGVITSMIYYYLGKRWLRLEVSEIIFGFIYYLSIISVFTTLFFYR